MTDPDLRRLRELGEALVPPGDQPPFALRWQVLAAIDRPAPRWRRRRSRGMTWAAAAVAACLAILPINGSAGLHRYPLEKTYLLKLAADRVAAAPAFSPRPDQFIYTESIAIYHEVRVHETVINERRVHIRAWRSVDGSREGLIQTMVTDVVGAPSREHPIPVCKPDACRAAQSAAGLPTDTETMLAYLYRADTGELASRYTGADERALSRAADVLRLSRYLPAVQAAALQALARIPGVSLHPGGVDAAGRHGIALTYPGKGYETELIFEPGTYKYLGVNRKMMWVFVVRDPDRHMFLPDEAIREAVTRVAVVDEVGQRGVRS
jgi:hypothetical protein